MASRSASRMVWVMVSVLGVRSGAEALGANDCGFAEVCWGGGDRKTAAVGFPPSPPKGGGLLGDLGIGLAPSPSNTAIGVLTLTPSVPAGTSSLATLPS